MTTDKIICPMCDSAELIPRKAVEHFCYKGHHFSLADLEYSECPACHSEVVTPAQIKRGEVRVRNEHRKIDNLLTSKEITKPVFRDSTNAFDKSEIAEVTQNLTLDKLMRLVLKVPQYMVL
jgi:YgiT-type zinc finger domain-containing protein